MNTNKRSFVILVTFLIWTSVACSKQNRRSIEMLLIVPIEGTRNGGSIEFVQIDQTGNGAQVRYRQVRTEPLSFRQGTMEWKGEQFQQAWDRLTEAGLRDTKRIVVRHGEASSELTSWLHLRAHDLDARADVYRLHLYWSGKLTIDDLSGQSVLNVWKDVFSEATPATNGLNTSEVLTIAQSCAEDWPREIRPVVWEDAQAASGFKGNKNCPEKWR
jgi:hypothetical protein